MGRETTTYTLYIQKKLSQQLLVGIFTKNHGRPVVPDAKHFAEGSGLLKASLGWAVFVSIGWRLFTNCAPPPTGQVMPYWCTKHRGVLGPLFHWDFVCENKWSTFQNPRINTWIPTTLEYVCHGILSTKNPNTNSELQWCKLQPMNMSSMKTTDQHLKDKCHSFKSPMWMESDPQSWYKPIFCSWEAKNESRIFQEKVTPLLHKIKVCIGLV